MKPVASLVILALTLQGCAPMAPVQGGAAGQRAAVDPCVDQSAQQIGTLLGAVAGGLLAKKFSDAKYAVPVGAAVGALIGHAIGKDVSRRRCELSQIAKKHDLEMRTAVLQLPEAGPGAKGGEQEAVGMTATLVDKGGNQFLPNSDQLTPAARAYFTEIAAAYTPRARRQGLDNQEAGTLDQSKVLIVGHTDDQEDTRLAADLSERRARAVADVFRAAGVPEASIYYQGAGETLPAADNHSEAGRAANRRVEIVDVANDSVMASYLQSRVATSSYFRPVGTPEADAVAQAPAAQPAAAPSAKPAAPARAAAKPAGGVALASARQPAANDAPAAPAGTASQAQSGAKPAATAIASAAPAAPRKPAASASRPALAKAGNNTANATASAADTAGFSLGGARFDQRSHQVSVGEPLRNDGFSLLPLAVADEAPLHSCVNDRARVSHAVKSLRGGNEYKVGDYQPGAYGTSWVGKVNGHLLSLNNVAVLRAGGLPASNPTVLIFKNFNEQGGVSRKPDFSVVPVVNTYAGSRGTLYRVFFDKGAPLRCIDVVLPASGPFKAEQGYVYQDRNQQTFASEFRPEVPARRL
ncbi:OmpA family protein [Oxalobacteraceae bacterium A2-2]